MTSAKFIKSINVLDPDSNGMVEIFIMKNENGGMFGIDSSFLEQCFEDDEKIIIPDVFNNDESVELNDI